MDLRQLRCFVVAAELENLTLAASRLRIAQSAVSRHIKLLEQELGVRLFDRIGRGLKLTANGVVLRDRARHLIDEFNHLKTDVAAGGGAMSGALRVGAAPSLGEVLFPPLAERYARDFPNVQLLFVTDLALALQNLIRTDRLDIAIVSFPDRDPDLAVSRLTSESLFLISAPAIAPDFGDECTIAAVARLPLLLPGFPSRERLGYERLAAIKGHMLNCRMESDSLSVLKSLALGGLGHLMLPHVAVAHDRPANPWVVSRIKGMLIQRYLMRRADRPMREPGEGMVKAIKEQVRMLIQSGAIR
jgi:LysR family nitrogen assimilation transcriptional regulator